MTKEILYIHSIDMPVEVPPLTDEASPDMAEQGDVETIIIKFPFIKDNEEAQRHLQELRRLLQEVRQGKEFRGEHNAEEISFLDRAAFYDRWDERVNHKPPPLDLSVEFFDAEHMVKTINERRKNWGPEYDHYSGRFETQMSGVYHALGGAHKPNPRGLELATEIFGGLRAEFFPELQPAQPLKQPPPLRKVA